MTGTSGEKEGDSSIEKLCEILSKIMEQPKIVSEVVKYALEQNPIKLLGQKNYISWARHARLILSSYGYEKLLVTDEGEMDAQTKQINNRALVWLLGSMELVVREQVETMSTVAEVWGALHNQFAGKSNKMHAARIMHELLHLKQDTKSVTEYAGEIKRLYGDLHYYHPFEPVDQKDMAIHHTWFQSFISKLFLDGLNQEFDLRRQLIFSKSEWPNLDDIISSIIEEETRFAHPKVDDFKKADIQAALSIRNSHTLNARGDHSNTKLKCDHCSREGHTIEKCFKIHGFPPGWKKGKPQPGGVRGGNWNRANHTATERELPVVDAQALEKYNSKLKLSEDLSSTQGSSTNSSYHATSQGINHVQTSTPLFSRRRLGDKAVAARLA